MLGDGQRLSPLPVKCSSRAVLWWHPDARCRLRGPGEHLVLTAVAVTYALPCGRSWPLSLVFGANSGLTLFPLGNGASSIVRHCSCGAGPGVLVGTVLTAVAVKYTFPYGWSWLLSLLFGAMFSATDPVAVVAVLKEARAPPPRPCCWTLTQRVPACCMLKGATCPGRQIADPRRSA